MLNPSLRCLVVCALAVGPASSLTPGSAVSQQAMCLPRDDFSCVRRNEQALRIRWPGVASRIGDTLLIHLKTGAALPFVDIEGPGDAERNYGFMGVLEPLDLILIDDRGYESHTHWLIHPANGRRQELECFPVMSPDGAYALCGYGMLDEGGPQAYVAVYRVAGDSLVREWSYDLGENEPINPRWLPDRSVEFPTRSVRGYGGEDPACMNRIYRKDGAWRITRCRR